MLVSFTLSKMQLPTLIIAVQIGKRMQIVANQSLPFGQGNRGTRQVSRAQPSPERIVNAAKPRIDPTQGAKRSAIGLLCQSMRPGNGQDLGDLPALFSS